MLQCFYLFLYDICMAIFLSNSGQIINSTLHFKKWILKDCVCLEGGTGIWFCVLNFLTTLPISDSHFTYTPHKVHHFKLISPHPGINLYHIYFNSVLYTHRTDPKLLELWYIAWYCFCMKLTDVGWLDELSIKKRREAAPFIWFQDTKFISGCKAHTIHFLIFNYSNKWVPLLKCVLLDNIVLYAMCSYCFCSEVKMQESEKLSGIRISISTIVTIWCYFTSCYGYYSAFYSLVW